MHADVAIRSFCLAAVVAAAAVVAVSAITVLATVYAVRQR